METIVELTCERCGNKFNRRIAEVNRSKKLGRKNFCSRKCQGDIENIPLEKRYHPENLTSKKTDELSNFRWYAHRLRTNSNRKDGKRKENKVDIEYLRDLWHSQNGICPITGWNLVLRTHKENDKLTIYHASVDRIDNSKGYIRGNVRFISVMANYARNAFTDSELIEFCKAASKHAESSQATE